MSSTSTLREPPSELRGHGMRRKQNADLKIQERDEGALPTLWR